MVYLEPPPPNPCSLQGNGYDWAARVLHSSAFIMLYYSKSNCYCRVYMTQYMHTLISWPTHQIIAFVFTQQWPSSLWAMTTCIARYHCTNVEMNWYWQWYHAVLLSSTVFSIVIIAFYTIANPMFMVVYDTMYQVRRKLKVISYVYYTQARAHKNKGRRKSV